MFKINLYPTNLLLKIMKIAFLYTDLEQPVRSHVRSARFSVSRLSLITAAPLSTVIADPFVTTTHTIIKVKCDATVQ